MRSIVARSRRSRSRTTELRRIAVVGASLAGHSAARTLRREGFDGDLVVVGDEPHRPYDRPPLSKGYLAGSVELERLSLKGVHDPAELDVEWRLGSAAVGLDLEVRAVALADGTSVEFDGLVIASGGHARTLPGTESLAGVHELRTLDDADALRGEFAAKPGRVAVVGAGFIGAEVAATARDLDLEVTIIEAAEVPMARVLDPRLGQVCADIHRDNGAELRLGVGVEAPIGADRVEGLRLSDGSVVEADVVVVGIGVEPTTGWLAESGLTIDNGVVCDATCLAAPGVVAAGDIARWPNGLFGETMRVEHWDNAIDQGAHAAKRLLAGDDAGPAFEPVPWFWSDQYDRKIQMAGRMAPTDEMQIISGSTDERRFAALFGRDDRVVGVFAMNRPRHVMQFRTKIAERMPWTDALDFAASM